MNSLSVWINAGCILSLALPMTSYGYKLYEKRETDYNSILSESLRDHRFKSVEYGERLSSVENDVNLVRNRLKADKMSTRCTTDQAITLDPEFVTDSNDKNDSTSKIESEDPVKEDDAEETTDPDDVTYTASPTIPYKSPAPRGTDPDHYLDDV